jgi:Zn-dependent protease
MFDLSDFNLHRFLLFMAALVICITVHEFAHAYSAYRAGDDTPKAQGRISLNPIDHLDPMGTIMMVVSSLSGFGIGWGKPVQINPNNFKHPRWDDLRVSLWGPLSNLLLAAVVGTAIRFWGPAMSMPVRAFVVTLVLVNIGLALFNLIPVTPLDGSHILAALLPYESSRRYSFFMARNGMLVFLGLIVLGSYVFPIILWPPADFLFGLFTGH